MTRTDAQFVVITPVRDEEEHLEKTIRSMIAQEATPAAWIIVNDGSRDRTGDVARRWTGECSWITVCDRPDRGRRDSAGGEIDAFYHGFGLVKDQKWDFVVKLDGDLSFEPDYFAQCLSRFQKHPRLGIGGGEIYNVVGDRHISEHNPDFHVRGAVKMYRRSCFEDIGGLLRRPGWDTVDEVTANYKGWTTKTFRDMPVLHYRYTGAAVGLWRNAIKNGLCNYVTGYHPLFMFLKCLKRLPDRPFLLQSVGLFYGFLSGYLRRIPPHSDRAVIAFVRKQQMNKLLFRESMWR